MNVKKPSNQVLWTELTSLFVGLPLLVYVTDSLPLMFALLWIIALGAWVVLRRQYGLSLKKELNVAGLKRPLIDIIIIRFLFFGVLLVVFTLFYDSGRFLGFVSERPLMWLMVMVLYPFLSALPQELVYRSFFMRRYKPLFAQGNRIVVMSALAFGFAHIVLQNWIAVVFSTIGGLMFAHTYRRSQSLAAVVIEHGLYGDFIFTIGLGWYFYRGSVVG